MTSEVCLTPGARKWIEVMKRKIHRRFPDAQFELAPVEERDALALSVILPDADGDEFDVLDLVKNDLADATAQGTTIYVIPTSPSWVS